MMTSKGLHKRKTEAANRNVAIAKNLKEVGYDH